MFDNRFSAKLFLLALTVMSLLFVQCGSRKKYVIDYKDLLNYSQLRLEEDSTVLVYSSNLTVLSNPIYLSKGKYRMRFKARGTIAAGELPNLAVQFGKYKIKDVTIKEGVNDFSVNFELPESTSGAVGLSFTNDYNSSNEDRNIFFYFPIVVEPY
jgi:hypothetical protein